MSSVIGEGFRVRHADGADADEVSLASGLRCPEPSLAKQSFKDEVDINTIVKRFGLTGTMPEDVEPPEELDYADVIDFRTAMDVVVRAREEFMRMPADVRTRFGNSPAAFHDFCTAQDGDGKLVNLQEMRRLGLAVKAPAAPVEPAPMKVEIVGGKPT